MATSTFRDWPCAEAGLSQTCDVPRTPTARPDVRRNQRLLRITSPFLKIRGGNDGAGDSVRIRLLAGSAALLNRRHGVRGRLVAREIHQRLAHALRGHC